MRVSSSKATKSTFKMCIDMDVLNSSPYLAYWDTSHSSLKTSVLSNAFEQEQSEQKL